MAELSQMSQFKAVKIKIKAIKVKESWKKQHNSNTMKKVPHLISGRNSLLKFTWCKAKNWS